MSLRYHMVRLAHSQNKFSILNVNYTVFPLTATMAQFITTEALHVQDSGSFFIPAMGMQSLSLCYGTVCFLYARTASSLC